MTTFSNLACTACVALMGLSAACNSELGDQVRRSHYSDYKEAIQGEAMAKGWIPEFLPKTATNIFEWHNVEINRTRAEFSFDVKADTEWLREFFTPVIDSRTNVIKRELMHSRGATISRKRPLRFYELSKNRDDVGYLAVDVEEGRAQFWSRAE